MHKMNRLKLVVCVERTLITFVKKKLVDANPRSDQRLRSEVLAATNQLLQFCQLNIFKMVFLFMVVLIWVKFTLAINLTTTTGTTNTTMMCTISTTNTTITCWGSSLKPVVAAEHLTPTPSPLLHLEQFFSFFPTVLHKIFFIDSLGNAKAINLCKLGLL